MISKYNETLYNEACKHLKKRVKASRYKHSLGVAETCYKLAVIYKYPNPEKARFTGLLHDWDKGLSAKEEQKKVRKYSISLNKLVVESMPWVLHGFTAAASLPEQFPEVDQEMCQAIARHTTADFNMSQLDMILYVADLIEPNRNFEGVSELRELVGNKSLEYVYFSSFKHTFMYLISSNAILYPTTLDLWNDFINQGMPDF